MANKTDIHDVHYLSFEGGGGKGLIYLGAIRALEDKLSKIGRGGKGPVIDINMRPEIRQIKGVSGASAGAITAFTVALGMTSKEIETEVTRTDEATYKTWIWFIKERTKISQFEKFFDRPSATFTKGVVHNSNRWEYDNKHIIWGTLIDTSLRFVSALVKISVVKLVQELYVFFSDNVALKRFFNSRSDTSDYTYSLLFNRGVFPAFTTREMFATFIQRYLYEKIDFKEIITRYQFQQERDPENSTIVDEEFKSIILNWREAITDETIPLRMKPAQDLTFGEFFYLTGVDMVITGTNVSRARPLYFSLVHTPDFPVTAAIAISMNIPIIFKPVYVDYTVNKNESSEYNNLFKGLWVDGGMLNNFPIHAFNNQKEAYMGYRGMSVTLMLSHTKSNTMSYLNKSVIGFRLKGSPEKKAPEADDMGVLLSYMGSLIDTFMYSGGDGQIRSQEEEERTIYLDVFLENQKNKDGSYAGDEKYFEISTTDFASAALSRERGDNAAADAKEKLIQKAQESTNEYFA